MNSACPSNGDAAIPTAFKAIVYGSYGHSTWVDEPHTAGGNRSDFDLHEFGDKRPTERFKYWAG